MSPGERIAAAAAAHTGCSCVLHVDTYTDVIIRPVDRTPLKTPYYINDPKLSTCALFAIGCLRLAGCAEDECVATYLPGGGRVRDAMVDIQALARRCGAWVSASSPVDPPKAGDIWIIADAQGMDAHTGVCLEDAVLVSGTSLDSPSWRCKTAEGGQFDGKGSTAVGAFDRQFVFAGNRWKLGQRFLLGYASAAKMPVPDDGDPLPHFDETDTKSA